MDSGMNMYLPVTTTDFQNERQECDDFDSNSVVLNYIYHILLEEEEREEQDISFPSDAIEAAERSFYAALTDQSATSPNNSTLHDNELARTEDNSQGSARNSTMQFIKGAEEGLKFLPEISRFFLGSQSETTMEGAKNHNPEPGMLRSAKRSVIEVEESVISQEFDRILLYNPDDDEELKRTKDKPSSTGQGRRRRNAREMDLESLLTLCAQAVTDNDRTTALDLLIQIRIHSSSTGNGIQRMARYFADALDVRLTGCPTTNLSSSITTNPRRQSELLKTYHLFLSFIPFRTVANFFTERSIMNAALSARKLHIIDFGIFCGFEWPLFIQKLASLPGGPPQLRITGVDIPQPGLRPYRRIAEAGRLLENYAKRFRVPFEFHGVMKNWENLAIKDFCIREDEILAVNSAFRFHQVSDEGVLGLKNPRNAIMDLIRSMNPAVFVFAIPNSAHGSPFFFLRFREAIYHFSSVFDMLDAVLSSEMPASVLFEEVMGRDIINAIAVEGPERIERPETARVWHQRLVRAGFCQMPIEREMMTVAEKKMRSSYHKDFFLDRNRGWLLLGWRGRALSACSAWKPI